MTLESRAISSKLDSWEDPYIGQVHWIYILQQGLLLFLPVAKVYLGGIIKKLTQGIRKRLKVCVLFSKT